jgi:RNA polymerase sigma factor (sigma-70 family)
VQTLAGNMWRDQWRKHNRDQKLGLLGRGDSRSAGADTGAVSALESAQSKEETPTQFVRFNELAKAEAECVSKLSDNMREVYVMRRQLELSFAEIAERTGGKNEATLRSHFMRARDKVRECLGMQIDALGSKIQGWQ